MTTRREPAMDSAEGRHAHALRDDSLLQSIAWLTRVHGRERSPESLVSGVPFSGGLSPKDALRVLDQAGYNAGLVERRLQDLHPLLLPAIMLMKNGDACVLLRQISSAAGVVERYEVLLPGSPHHQCWATPGELDIEFSGYLILATPRLSSSGLKSAQILDPKGHWFWGTMRRFIPYYRASLLAALLSNVLMLVTGLVTSVIYDKVIPHQAFVTLWALMSGAVLALLFDLFAKQLRANLIDLAGRKSDLIVGSLLYRQTLGVRMEHRPASAGSYAHYLGQVEVVREFFASASLAAVSDLPFIAIYIGMCFVIGGPLGWVLVLSLPLLMLLSWAVQGALRKAMSANMEQQAELQGVLIESLEGLEDLKAAGAEGRFLHLYESSTAVGAEAAMRARSMSSWSMNVLMSAQQAITLIMLTWGVYLIHDGAISQGALIGAVMFAQRAIQPLGMLVNLATRYQGARAAMKSIDELMSKPLERDEDKTYVSPPEFTGQLALRDVSFSYPAQGDDVAPKVLKNIHLLFPSGDRVAILGRIGSGKSTILRLLGGLYQPTEGAIEVEGIDLRQIDPADFRTQVGFVSQDPRLFNGTLRENVLLGRVSADASQLSEVARVTGLDRLVASHPQGWDLPVGEMGSLLSGGQRQLVALARALVTRPKVLLMDEPTSSMDAQSEIAFLRQLKEAIGGCTLIMVTHRPAVLELVNRIIVIDQGKQIMDGQKDQVLAALSGVRPIQDAQANPRPAATNLHMHPAAQPVQRDASL